MSAPVPHSHADSKPSAPTPSYDLGKALSDAAARHIRQPKLCFAIAQNGLDLRVAFEALGHAHHPIGHPSRARVLMIAQ